MEIARNCCAEALMNEMSGSLVLFSGVGTQMMQASIWRKRLKSVVAVSVFFFTRGARSALAISPR